MKTSLSTLMVLAFVGCAAQPASEVADSAQAPADWLYTPCGGDREVVLAHTAKLTEKARGTYPRVRARFLAGLPDGHHLFVRITLAERGAEESLFLAVQRIERGQVIGNIASDVARLRSWRFGDPYGVSEATIEDWVISKPDGTEEGNIIGRWIETLKNECGHESASNYALERTDGTGFDVS